MENALSLEGGQTTLIAITIALTVLGLAGLALAMFSQTRWRVKYSLMYMFVLGLFAMAWYADWNSTRTYTAYQAPMASDGEVSGNEVTGEDGFFDRTLTVITFQWGFAFITEDNEISRNAAIVKPGEKVLFKILSNDVIHGFNIPAASITAEVDPDVVRKVWIRTPDEPGKYLIQCVNYCGVGHAQMKAWLVVEDEEDEEEGTAELTVGEADNDA